MARRTCGYCGDTGHNRSTCPQEKASIEKTRERDPDNYRVRWYDSAQAARKESRKYAAANRSCSYCSQSGHNRRSCSTLKQDKHYAVIANAEERVKILDYMRTEGIGVGALMVLSSRVYNEEEGSYERKLQPHLLRKINWQVLDFAYFETGLNDREHQANTEPLEVVNLKTGEVSKHNLLAPSQIERRKREVKEALEKGEAPWGLYTPVPVSNAEAVTPPQGWLESRSDTHLLDLRFGGKGKKATTKYDVRNRMEFAAVDEVIERYKKES